MGISEFDIIKQFFKQPGLIPDKQQSANLPLGIGDDCALLEIPTGKQLAVSMDTLVADVHFFPNDDPALIAQRALAVNLSDLAAMGAEPLAFTLSLSLPLAKKEWIQAFSQGLELMVQEYQCPLIGGDITRGPLSITIQVHGLVERGTALTRSAAKPGDQVYVSGELGAAGLAVSLIRNGMSLEQADRQVLHKAYYKPEPRLELGQLCRGIASAAIDISDGLLGDAQHIAEQSAVGIELELKSIPVARQVKAFMRNLGDSSAGVNHALTAGDDYELVLTVNPENAEQLQKLAQKLSIKLTRVGQVVKGSQVKCFDKSGDEITLTRKGFQHFS